MKKALVYLALPLCSGLLLAQSDSQASSQPSMPRSQNTWTGLLVATGCQSGSTATSASNAAVSGTSSNTTGSPLNSTNSATAGTADRAATSGDVTGRSDQNTAVNSAATDAKPADQNFPRTTASAAETGMPMRTGDMDVVDQGTSKASATTGSADRSWSDARMQAKNLGPACRVSVNTTSYSLMMPDGRLIPFDSASNQKIADQIHNRFPNNSTKVFRVVVKGSMQGETIALDTLQI